MKNYRLKRKHGKQSSFLCLCYILRAIVAGRCRERRYADHIFIQIYFRMHHFVVRFSKFSLPQAAKGHWPLTKILQTFLRLTSVARRPCRKLGFRSLTPADLAAKCRIRVLNHWVTLSFAADQSLKLQAEVLNQSLKPRFRPIVPSHWQTQKKN